MEYLKYTIGGAFENKASYGTMGNISLAVPLILEATMVQAMLNANKQLVSSLKSGYVPVTTCSF